MRPSTFRPQTVLTGAGFALPDQEKLATVYGNMSKAPKGASTSRLLPTCPIVSAKAAGGERILQKIHASNGDVFRQRPVLRPSDWLYMLWRAVRAR